MVGHGTVECFLKMPKYISDPRQTVKRIRPRFSMAQVTASLCEYVTANDITQREAATIAYVSSRDFASYGEDRAFLSFLRAPGKHCGLWTKYGVAILLFAIFEA